MFNMKKIIISLLVIAAIGMTWYLIKTYKEEAIFKNPAFASGNGRLEATEINIAAKLAGKIEQLLVDEGDYVKGGQTLVQMQINTLTAELEQANAQIKVKEAELEQAKAQLQVEEASLAAANASLASAKSALAAKTSTYNNAKSRYERSKELMEKDVTSRQTFENDEALYQSAAADVDSAKADIQSVEASIKSVEATIVSDKAAIVKAEAAITAAKADADRIQADIDDSTLTAPIDGRIQYRIAEAGEVLSSGGRVLNLVDLTDVYLTFFVPEEVAGQIALGADARIVVDAMDDVAIPASISYVASVAQFTPKSVETRVEREKLMFRVKAKISADLLKQYVEYVKTGIPGVAWVRLDDKEPWPDFLLTPKEKGLIPPPVADKVAETNGTAAQ
ncbi:MAG: HlyD family efflux transporter periplasmic adaptor subunit [Lentisphaeria bacterium]|nr:HlyD family efflux transporter periplasmic adaptor subunit [Lentisphaeria bacterium]